MATYMYLTRHIPIHVKDVHLWCVPLWVISLSLSLSAITIQFTSSVFAADYDPTIGEWVRKEHHEFPPCPCNYLSVINYMYQTPGYASHVLNTYYIKYIYYVHVQVFPLVWELVDCGCHS